MYTLILRRQFQKRSRNKSLKILLLDIIVVGANILLLKPTVTQDIVVAETNRSLAITLTNRWTNVFETRYCFLNMFHAYLIIHSAFFFCIKAFQDSFH